MHVISKRTLIEFYDSHADAKGPLEAWHHDASLATWKSPEDIKQTYANASILADNRVCFNIKGNNYRLIVRINYASGTVFVKFIGTHAGYDKVNAETVGKPNQ